jgi:hypothetical protein
MGTLQFKNNASTTLSGSINNSQTAITVASAAAFPVPSAGDYFYATMYELSGSTEINLEIVKVTAVSGNNWTIVRAQDGTTARARDGVSTCYIEQRMTAASAQLMVQRDNNLSDLGSVATARTNLGLGSMATQDASSVAITGGTISGVTINGIDSTTTISDNADNTKKVAFEVSGISTGTTRTLTVPNASGTIALTSDLTAGYQPLDSDLTALAGLSANGLIARTGGGTVAARSLTAPAAGITVTNGDGVSGNPTLVLANDLAAVEGIATTGFVRRTGVDTWSASAIVDGDLPSALSGKTYNALTLTANATGFSVSGGTSSKTLTVSNSITLAGTDGTTVTLPATSGTVALNNQTMFIGTTSVAINRSSGSLSLTGVNIDGAAGSATTATTATKATNLVGGNGTTLLGAIGYQSAADTTTLLSPNTTATKQFLSMTGTGTNGAAPAWSAVSKSDVGLSAVENTALSTWAGSSNLTTLGTVGTGTWNATTISIAKGGTGATTALTAFDALAPTTTLGDVIYHDGTDNVRLAGNTSTTRRFLRQTGTGTVSAAPAWDTLTDPDIPSALTGKTYNSLTLTAASVGFTIAGGATSKTFTLSNTLTLAGTDGSTLNVGAGGTLGSAAYTASTAYAPAAGSASIATVGTITSGTWTGSAIGISYGGTGATSKTAGYNALSPMTTLGDLAYHDGTNAVRLAGNTTSSKRFLTQTGTGTVSAAPGWNALADGDLPSSLTGKTYNGLTLTANATGFAVAGGTTAKTLTISNNLTFAGTDGSTLNIGAGGTLGSAAYTATTAYLPVSNPTITGTATASGPIFTTGAISTHAANRLGLQYNGIWSWGGNSTDQGTLGIFLRSSDGSLGSNPINFASDKVDVNVKANISNTGASATEILRLQNTTTSGGAAALLAIGDTFGGVFHPAYIGADYYSYGMKFVTNRDSSGFGFDFRNAADTTSLLKIDSSTGYFHTPEKTSTLFGVSNATSSGSGGDLTVKAGGGFGAGNSSGNLFLGSGRGSSSANNGYIAFGRAKATNAPGLDSNGEFMRIDSAGNVGINTTSPLTKLDVRGNAFIGTTDNGNNILGFGWTSMSGAPDAAPGSAFIVSTASNAAGGATNLAFWTTSGGSVYERMRITPTGNVGIGTTSPSAMLDVAGSVAIAGNLTFSGTGRTILGDFTNATNSLRTAFQSSTTNGITVVTAKPNGTATNSYFITHNASDVDNSSHMYMGVTATQAQLRSDKTGTGSLLPLAIYVGGAERAVVDTSGNVTPSVDNAQTLGSASKRWSDVQTASVSAGSYNGGQLAGMRNKIINGKMDIAQRGTSFSGVVSSTTDAFAADRFRLDQSGHSATLTLSQQTDVPSSNEFQNSARVAVTTADSSIAAGDVLTVSHFVEGYNAKDLIGKTFTLSFWVRSSKTGTHCVSFCNSGADRSYIKTYSVSVANTWEYKTVVVPAGLITAGTWNWTNGKGVAVRWALAAGTSWHTTADAWQTGNFVATSAQVNCLDTVGNIFAITGVQLETGSVATPFEHRPYAYEVAMCQRYYCLANYVHSLFAPVANIANYGGAICPIHFPVVMRDTPTMTYTQTAAQNWNGTAGTSSISADGVLVSASAMQTVAGAFFAFNWTASAEL